MHLFVNNGDNKNKTWAIIVSPLMRAVKNRDKVGLQKALSGGADVSNSGSTEPSNDALYFCILTSQYDMASIILSHLSKFHSIILEYTPLDRDSITIILEYFGNIHNQIRFGWSRICQLGWINSMYDLKLLQLLIFHGPRNIINRRSPDFGEHFLVSGIKNNCQIMIKIILSIYREELGNDLYHSITNNLEQDLKYYINRIKNEEHKKEINEIFYQYHNDFYKLQTECFAMILSDQFGKFIVLQSYIKQRSELFPVLRDVKFKQLLSEMTIESQQKLKQYIAKIKAEKAEKAEKTEETKQDSSNSYYESCLLQ